MPVHTYNWKNKLRDTNMISLYRCRLEMGMIAMLKTKWPTIICQWRFSTDHERMAVEKSQRQLYCSIPHRSSAKWHLSQCRQLRVHWILNESGKEIHATNDTTNSVGGSRVDVWQQLTACGCKSATKKDHFHSTSLFNLEVLTLSVFFSLEIFEHFHRHCHFDSDYDIRAWAWLRDKTLMPRNSQQVTNCSTSTV